MENDYTYIGFLCIDENRKPVLITKSDKIYNISGIESSSLQKDITITEYEAMIMGVKYFDGFDSVELDYAHEIRYENIIIAI